MSEMVRERDEHALKHQRYAEQLAEDMALIEELQKCVQVQMLDIARLKGEARQKGAGGCCVIA